MQPDRKWYFARCTNLTKIIENHIAEYIRSGFGCTAGNWGLNFTYGKIYFCRIDEGYKIGGLLCSTNTIATDITYKGIGLHSGTEVIMAVETLIKLFY